MNPYLKRLRDQYEGLRSGIESVQTRAAEENRDLTEDELRTVTEQGEQAQGLYEQIESMTAIEARNAQVAALATTLPVEQNTNETETRGRAYTQDRDPGHYRSEQEGGQNSFFADHFRASRGDAEAQRRLDEHHRAVTTASGGAGIVLPKWLVSEYESLARQGRIVANRVRNLPLGRDPRPIELPKQTAGTDPNLTVQAAQGANNPGWSADRITTNKDTLTPEAYSASQIVSRQLLDSSTPAADLIVFSDLRGAWDDKVESLVCAKILADGTAAGTTFATEAAFQAGAIDAVIDAETAVAEALRGPADLAIMSYRRFGAFRKLEDTTGRKLMPVSRYNPQNASGSTGNSLVGDIEGVDALGTNGVPATYAEKFAVLRSQSVYLGESDLLDFTYTENVGPASVQMGIWGYVGVLVRHPLAVSVQTVTAAS